MVQKDKINCLVIEFACPDDGRVDTTDLEKIKYYQDRRVGTRVEKDMNMKVKVIPLVICALGRTPIKLRNWT